MKALFLCTLVLSCVTAAAQSSKIPSFDDQIVVPELSLQESIKQELLPAVDELPKVRGAAARADATSRGPRMVSHMPVFIANGEVDKNMPVVRPDPSVDHKMVIRKPSLEPMGEVKLGDKERSATLRQRFEAARQHRRSTQAAREEELKRKAQRN